MSEIQKLEEAATTHRDLSDFLEWLSMHQDYALAEYLRENDQGEPRINPILVPVGKSAQAIIFEYLGIDEKALEQERRALLTAMRQLGADRVK